MQKLEAPLRLKTLVSKVLDMEISARRVRMSVLPVHEDKNKISPLLFTEDCASALYGEEGKLIEAKEQGSLFVYSVSEITSEGKEQIIRLSVLAPVIIYSFKGDEDS